MTNESGTIEPGQPIPQATVQIKTDDGIDAHETAEYFASGRTVMFALPGAFTSTCSAKHLPEFVGRADDLKAAGIDRIACLAVNDAHVLKAWGDQHGTAGKIDMLADPHAEFARALGLAVNMGDILGERATRCAMIIDDGVLTKIMMEEVGAYEVSSPAHVLTQL
jgi:peroxiredoxin